MRPQSDWQEFGRQEGLTGNHECESETFLHCFPVDLIGQRGEPHVLLVLILQTHNTPQM